MKSDPTSAALARAVDHLRGGGLLAYPTETVWGLGADARSEVALQRLRAWKGREAQQPVAILVDGADTLAELDFELGPAALRAVEKFWPGPLTLVLRSRAAFARGIAREDAAVGVRCASHPLARALARRLREAGVGPITATSLNRSGAPPACRRDEARALCGEGPEEPRLLAVENAECGGEAPSSVLDLAAQPPRVLRWGALGPADLEPVLPELSRA